MDILFNRRASVGLMVLAPNPVAMDCLRPFPPGVVVRPGVPLLLFGVVWITVEVFRGPSGVFDGVRRSLEERFMGASPGRALIVLGDLDPFRLLPPLLSKTPIDIIEPLLSALDFRPLVYVPLYMSLASETSGGRKVPGPIDFLGAFAVVAAVVGAGGGALLNAFGGN